VRRAGRQRLDPVVLLGGIDADALAVGQLQQQFSALVGLWRETRALRVRLTTLTTICAS
jgi:hypothetical protein